MNLTELRSTFALGSIFAVRMLGLFMILPIFSLYAQNFTHSTPLLIGLAIGIYGFSQACLQIPFGMLSDVWGRKPIICFGLVLFALGSLLAGQADSIYAVIAGRALQGAGAIGSTTLALLTDLTREDHRAKAMALIGMVIGFSFSLAMILGPVLQPLIQLHGLFNFTAALSGLGIIILFTLVPRQAQAKTQPLNILPALLAQAVKNPDLWQLNLGIMSLHAILTSAFIAIPLLLHYFLPSQQHVYWPVYLPVLLIAFTMALIFIAAIERFKWHKPGLICAIFTLALSQPLIYMSHNSHGLMVAMCIFLTAFSILEATLPALVAKTAKGVGKGTAMGVYSSCQFAGIFLGGILGGWLYGHYPMWSVFAANSLIAMIWLTVVVSKRSATTKAREVRLGSYDGLI